MVSNPINPPTARRSSPLPALVAVIRRQVRPLVLAGWSLAFALPLVAGLLLAYAAHLPTPGPLPLGPWPDPGTQVAATFRHTMLVLLVRVGQQAAQFIALMLMGASCVVVRRTMRYDVLAWRRDDVRQRLRTVLVPYAGTDQLRLVYQWAEAPRRPHRLHREVARICREVAHDTTS